MQLKGISIRFPIYKIVIPINKQSIQIRIYSNLNMLITINPIYLLSSEFIRIYITYIRIYYILVFY